LIEIAVIESASWQWWRDLARRPRFRLTRAIFLRGLGLVYLAAFGSLAVQLDGLLGSQGILPAAEYLDRAARALGRGPATYWRLPTFFWFNASDTALHAACYTGVTLSVALIAGLLPGLSAVLLWLLYLSFVVVGQVFLGYQWDSLLLETGLLAVLLAPWCVRLSRAGDQPWWFAIYLVRWLTFRLMFLSGFVKLASHDPTWQDWTALEYHYQTQPLPTWASWYIHQVPAGFQAMSVGFMFFAELIAPFFVFGPRPLRLVGFASLVLLQLLIAATGNYGFFNLLAIVLCLCILDDRDWESVRRAWGVLIRNVTTRRTATEHEVPVVPLKPWSVPRRLGVGLVGGVILLVTATQTLEIIAPSLPIPSTLDTLSQWVGPLRSMNHYGLFAVMTTTRPEIIVEGSDDGAIWKPYRFRWKPCELDRRPRFAVPHLPRLDWQMWFAALGGDCRSAPWFMRFEQKLLDASPAVLGLLRENPFPTRPPRYVRARLYLYSFTRWGSHDWWSREEQGLFCPPLTSEYFR
jgi:hypothetical protein